MPPDTTSIILLYKGAPFLNWKYNLPLTLTTLACPATGSTRRNCISCLPAISSSDFPVKSWYFIDLPSEVVRIYVLGPCPFETSAPFNNRELLFLL